MMKRSYFHMMKPLVAAEKPRKSVVVALRRIARVRNRQPPAITFEAESWRDEGDHEGALAYLR